LASVNKTWTIEIARTAEKQIKKVGRQAQESIVRFLRDRLQPSANPRQWGKPPQGDKGGLWRYRVGDYRLVCAIQDDRITVLVLRVGDPKNVYR